MNKNHETVQLSDRLDQLKQSMRGIADLTTERAGDLKRFIVANPLPAVAIAFGIGYVAMRIVRR